MATRLRTVVHCVLLTGLIMSPLTLVALAADAPLEVKKTTSDAQPVQRKVRATLLVHATEPVVWRAENKFDLAQFDFYKRNVAAMVKSSVVIDKALEEKSVRDLPLIKQHGDNATDWLADQIKIEYPGNAEVMTISMVAEDRDQACMIVNAVASAFMKEVVDKERTDKLGRNDNLDKKFRAYKQQVLEKQRQLYELNQSIGTNDAETARIKYKMEVDTLDSFMRTRAEIQKQVFDLSLKNDMA
ncbi:MAG TPA: hypothetical protein VG056_14805, partial [Pirellulales bacterium]|nr:hypothetical protein [Pirellulales bacterium]